MDVDVSCTPSRGRRRRALDSAQNQVVVEDDIGVLAVRADPVETPAVARAARRAGERSVLLCVCVVLLGPKAFF